MKVLGDYPITLNERRRHETNGTSQYSGQCGMLRDWLAPAYHFKWETETGDCHVS